MVTRRLITIAFLCFVVSLAANLQAQQITLLSQLVNAGSESCAVDNNKLYFDSGNKLVISNISNAQNPTVLGSLILESMIFGLDAKDSIAAVILANGQLAVLDVSVPGAITLHDTLFLGTIEVDPFLEEYAAKVIIHGDSVFVALENYGVIVIDISVPSNISVAATYNPGINYSSYGLAVRDSLLFLGIVEYGFSNNFIRIVDFTNIAGLTEVGALALNDVPEGICFRGDTAFVAAAGQGLVSVDLSNINSPTIMDTSYYEGWYSDVDVEGDYAFIASYDQGMVVVDISDPGNMADGYIANYLSENTYAKSSVVVVSDGHAYLPMGASGLEVLDLTDPTIPVFVAKGAPNSGGSANGVAYRDDYAYIADGPNGLTIVDVADPINSSIIRHVDFDGHGLQVALFGDYAYVSGTRGLEIVDISSPADAEIVGSFSNWKPGNAMWGQGVDVRNDTCYFTYMGFGLCILDVSDPSNPIEIANYSGLGWAIDITVDGGLAYLQYLNNGGGFSDAKSAFAVLDITNIQDPQQVGFWQDGEAYWSNDMLIHDDMAYVGSDDGVHLVDISDPTNPQTIGFYAPNNCMNLALSGDGNHLYVAKEGGGLKILDVSDPTNPHLAIGYNTAGQTYGVDINDSLVYLADGDGGFLILNHEFAPVAVDTDQKLFPKDFVLEQNYPNPFNPSTTLSYELPEASDISLIIYDVRGKIVRTIESGHLAAGRYTYVWNGLDSENSPVSTGVYFAQLGSESGTQTTKMVYLK